MDTSQAQAYTVKVCKEVLLNLSKRNGISAQDIKLRIDMENLADTPRFAVFDKLISLATLKEKCTLKQVISAGGGQAIAMLLTVHVKNIIRDIFAAAMQRYEIGDTKQVFLILHLAGDETAIPTIAVYKDNRLMDAPPVGDIIGVK